MLWGAKEGQRRIHWKNWIDLCTPKAAGGLGFREFGCFNATLLGKQLWRIYNQPESLAGKVLKAKYFPSYLRQSLITTKSLLSLGMVWCIESAFQVRIYEDPWIPTLSNFKLPEIPQVYQPYCLLSTLIDPVSRGWNLEMILNSFPQQVAQGILKIPLNPSTQDDQLYWLLSRPANALLECL